MHRSLAALAILGLSLSACEKAGTATSNQAAIPPASPADPVSTAALVDVGPPLAMAPPVITGDWTQNGWWRDVSEPPLDGPGFASYAPKGDVGVGTLTWTGPVPKGVTALAIPIITGPVATAVKYTVVDGDTGAAIASLASPPPNIVWKIWRVSLPAKTASIRVVANDDGTAWGEWTGIAIPHGIISGH